MKYRLAVILPTYLLLYVCCYYGAYLLRFEFFLTKTQIGLFQTTLPIVVLLKSMMCMATGEWQRTYRYATLRDLLWTGVAGVTSAVLIAVANFTILSANPVPGSIILIDFGLFLLGSATLRMALRVYREVVLPLFSRVDKNKERALVLLSDQVGLDIVRALNSSESKYHVVGFVERHSAARKSLLFGLPVFPSDYGWKALSEQLNASHLLIPTTIPGREVRQILDEISDTRLNAHIIPHVDDLMDGRFKLQIRDVTISDLLRREPNQLDFDKIEEYLSGKRVLVTGGAGSIGSECCRQILSLNPASLVVLDQSEFGVFSMEQEFKDCDTSNTELHYVVADITDRRAMQRVMSTWKPEIVFHAAAYKHVPLMEVSPHEAIYNNVMGTRNVVDLADECGVERFVLISTDKAVRPTSVMGSTKLLAEKYLQGKARHSQTRYITVRFGNVLNSAGSVIPTFRRQIENGGPLTVTHPEMERFFMTIPEAVQLVLQAGAIGNSGDILILEMGNPVKIVDLARDMIQLSGLKYPDDIDIVFTGIRPGEKLYEELFYDTEDGAKQVHEKIFCATPEVINLSRVESEVSRLKVAIQQQEPAPVLETLWEIVGGYVTEDQQRERSAA